MRPIDEKIISMKLDNRDFATKAAQTTGIIGALTKTLNLIPGVNLGKTSKDLGNIRDQANKTNFSRLADSVDTVAKRFSALGIMGVTALQNITNRAVNAGMVLAKSLSTDQVTAGFQEYELKMGSIQTILANTSRHGTTLEEVSTALNELNEYADKTIYNFGDMTKNIGLFTNAGLKVQESTSMIKGFSNAAAASGANSENASRAAYQLSQGLSQGYLMTMDWMSLTNAGMGNDNMKRDLIAMGQAMGTLNKSTETTLTNWKDTLSEDRWLTSDVMSKYLQAMAGDMDEAALKAIGLSDAQAKVLLTNAKTGEEAATYVRTFTQLMDTLKEGIGSGWATTFEHIFGDFNDATKLWTSVSNAAGGYIDKTSQARNDMLKELSDKGGFQNIFAGIADSAKPVIQIFGALTTGFEKVFPPLTVDRIMSMTESFKEFAAGLTLSGSTVGKFATIFQGVFALFSTVIEIAKRLTSAFVSLIPEGAGDGILNLLVKLAEMAIKFNESVKAGNGLTDFIDGLARGLKSVGQWVSDAIGPIASMAKALGETLGGALKFVIDLLRPVGAFLKDAFSGIGMEEILGAGTLTGGFLLFKKFGDILDEVTGLFGTAKSGITGLFDELGGALSSFQQQVKYDNLLKIAIAVGIIAVSLKLLEGIDGGDIAKGITALATSLGIMLGAMMLIDKFSITGGIKASVTLIALASAVTIMAVALKIVAGLDLNEMVRGVTGLMAITTTLAIAVIAISKFGGKIKAGSLQLIALATAVLILASAVETLSAIDSGNLWKAVGALGVIFLEMGVFLKIVDRTKLSVSSAVGLVAITGAIHIMVSAIDKIADIDTASLVKGLATITIILAQMVLFSMFAKGPSLLLAGAGLLVIASALTLLLVPIGVLSKMTWEELIKGLGGITLAMVAIGGASMLMSGVAAAGLGLIVMAAGLTLLMIPIKMFASMTWTEMLKGFAGLAIAMGLLAGAALLLTPAVVPMLGFGAAVALMGLAMLAAGLGVGLFAAGLVALATLTATSIAAIIAALKLLIEGLGSLIIYVVKFVVDLGVALLDGLAELIPKVVKLISILVMELISTMSEKVPEFARLGAEFIINMMNGIAEYYPKLVDAGMNMIVEVVDGLANALEEHGPRIIDAFMHLFGEIILLAIEAGNSMTDALIGWIPGVKKATSQIGAAAEYYVDENFRARELGEYKGEDFVYGLRTKQVEALKAGTSLGDAGTEGLAFANPKIVGIKFGEDFISGMTSKNADVNEAAKSMSSGAKFSMEDYLDINSPSKVTDAIGKFTGQGFADGIESTKPKAKKAAKKVADAAKTQFDKSKEWISERKYYNELTLKQELDAWLKIQKQYKAGTDQRKEADREVFKLRNDLIKEDFDNSKAWIDDRKYYDELSLKEELAAWVKIQAKYKEGTEQRKQADREVYKLRKDLVKEDFDNSKSYLDDRKYYNELSLKDELASWERIQARYEEGTEQRKEADRELYRLRNELMKADFENSKTWMDDRKYYNDLSLTEELSAWERVQARYLAGSEERKQADREVYRLKNEINTQLIQLNDEYTSKIQEANKKLIDDEIRLNEDRGSRVEEANQKLLEGEIQFREEYDSKVEEANKKLYDAERQFREEYDSRVEDANLNLLYGEIQFREEYEEAVIASNDRLISEELRLTEAYDNAVNERTKSLISFAGLFDEIPEKSEVSGQTLIDNLKGQVDTFTDWSENIDELSGRAIDEGLLAELRAMGPKAAGEIAALNSLTDEQLTEYSDLWKNKNELARTEAVKELEYLREDTHSEIEKLRKETQDQLEDYKKDWHTKTEELRAQTTVQLEAFKNDWNAKTEDIRIQTSIQLDGLKRDWQTKTDELRNQTNAQVSAINDDFYNSMEELRSQTATQLDQYRDEWISKIEELSQGTKDNFVDLTTDMQTIGSDIIKGMISGMQSEEGALIEQSRAMADAVADAMRSTLNIQSPSRVTETIGKFTGEGVAIGIASQIKNVAGRAKELALTAKDSFANFMEGFDLPEEDNEIHIKAVVDWDGLNPNDLRTRSLRITPDTSFTTNSATAVKAAYRQNDDKDRRDTGREPQMVTKEVKIEQNLTFNSRQLTPSETARKNRQASRQLAAQWGV